MSTNGTKVAVFILFAICGCNVSTKSRDEILADVSLMYTEQKLLSEAIRDYVLETGNLPISKRTESSGTIHVHEIDPDYIPVIKTFVKNRKKFLAEKHYNRNIFSDVFGTNGKVVMNMKFYSTVTPMNQKIWIVWSRGPDGEVTFWPQYVSNFSIENVGKEISNYAYDPTNGLISEGDIIRFGFVE